MDDWRAEFLLLRYKALFIEFKKKFLETVMGKKKKKKKPYTAYLFSVLGWISNLGFLRKKKRISENKNLLLSHKRNILTLESNGMIWGWSLKTYKWEAYKKCSTVFSFLLQPLKERKHWTFYKETGENKIHFAIHSEHSYSSSKKIQNVDLFHLNAIWNLKIISIRIF